MHPFIVKLSHFAGFFRRGGDGRLEEDALTAANENISDEEKLAIRGLLTKFSADAKTRAVELTLEQYCSLQEQKSFRMAYRAGFVKINSLFGRMNFTFTVNLTPLGRRYLSSLGATPSLLDAQSI